MIAESIPYMDTAALERRRFGIRSRPSDATSGVGIFVRVRLAILAATAEAKHTFS